MAAGWRGYLLLALGAGFFLTADKLLGFAPFSLSFVVAAFVVGLGFAVVQGLKKVVTYRTRLISSAISMAIAGYFVAAGVSPFIPKPAGKSLFSIVYLLLAASFVRSDQRMWRWFSESGRA